MFIIMWNTYWNQKSRIFNFQDHFKRASSSKYKWRSDLSPSKLSLACFSLNARWRDPCSRHSSTFLINSNLWSIVNGGDVGAASKSRRIPGSWLIKERLLWATSSRWILHASRLTADHTHLHTYPHRHHSDEPITISCSFRNSSHLWGKVGWPLVDYPSQLICTWIFIRCVPWQS